MITVYALLHPVSFQYFYIGATSMKLQYRLSGHCTKSFDNSRLSKIVDRRICFIRGIEKVKTKPIIVELACVEKWLVDHCEMFYYKILTNLGYELLQDSKKFCYTRQHTDKAIAMRTLKKNGGKKR